jgi:hypothetical protein
VYGARIWVVGGAFTNGSITTVFDDVQVLDPATNSWSTIAPTAPQQQRHFGNLVVFRRGTHTDLRHVGVDRERRRCGGSTPDAVAPAVHDGARVSKARA